jgi:hypothetical protein
MLFFDAGDRELPEESYLAVKTDVSGRVAIPVGSMEGPGRPATAYLSKK